MENIDDKAEEYRRELWKLEYSNKEFNWVFFTLVLDFIGYVESLSWRTKLVLMFLVGKAVGFQYTALKEHILKMGIPYSSALLIRERKYYEIKRHSYAYWGDSVVKHVRRVFNLDGDKDA